MTTTTTLIACWGAALLFVGIVTQSILGYSALAARLLTAGDRASAASPSRSRTLPASSFVLGMGGLATLCFLVGMSGGAYNALVQTVFVAGGMLALGMSRRLSLGRGRVFVRSLIPLATPQGRDRWWLVLPAVYFLTRFFTCGVPQQHSDPLYYHLLAPKFWAELGQIRITAEHPSFAQSALWEALLGLPMFWVGTTGVVSHVITQLYGQWMHMLFGQIASCVLGAVVIGRLAPRLANRPGLSFFVAWLCTSLPVQEWLGCLAKNDYILLTLALAALLETLNKKWVLVGLLVGLAYSTKVFAIWLMIGLLVLIPPKKWIDFGFAALFAMAAFLGRNIMSTGNPYFPALDNVIGPHWISDGWNSHNAGFIGAPHFDAAMLPWISNQLLHRSLPKILLALGLAGALWRLWRRRSLTALETKWILFFTVQLALLLTMLRPGADGRYGIYIISPLLLTLLAVAINEVLLRPRARQFGWLALAPLGLLINSPVDQLVKIPRDYLFKPASKYVEQFHPCADAMAWIHENTAPTDRVLFTQEKQLFYLDRSFETVSEMRKWEQFFPTTTSVHDLFAKLRQQGYRYIHLSPQTAGPDGMRPYWPQLMAARSRAAFNSGTSVIFDLNKVPL